MDVFVAPQPIFDREQVVYGYELLFRDSLTAVRAVGDMEMATSQILAESPALIGVESLTGGRMAFVNVTRDLLLSGCASLLPPRYTVLEILENVEPDETAVQACRALKQVGFRIALDDFTSRDRHSPLLAVADLVKLDFLATEPGERQSLVASLAPTGVRLLAEKVETPEQFQEARDLGFELFQGYFFSRPVTVSSKCIPGIKLHYLRILREIHRPELDLDLVEDIVKQDVSLSYRLLRHLNTAFFAFHAPVHSVRQALLVIGEREFRKWVSVIALAKLAGDRPEELVVQALIRARLCEGLAAPAGLPDAADDCFLMGMFSLVDAMVGRPLAELLTHLPVTDEVRDALLERPSRLRPVLDYARALERGDWDAAAALAGALAFDEAPVPGVIGDAIAYGRGGPPA
jgi:c-di-GMP-related signal transduction protein